MNMEKELKKFAASYENEVQELLVLTSESVGGAGRVGKGPWKPSAEFLASVDLATGELIKGEGNLFWLAGDEDKDGWIFHLKPLTIYHIKCRAEKKKDSAKQQMNSTDAHGAVTSVKRPESYMLVEVVERELRHPGLEQILEEYQRVVEFTDELCGCFTLERRFSWFSGEVDWLGQQCLVSLNCDQEGGETADNALAYFKQIYGNLQEFDKQFRQFAAEKLTKHANDWLEEEEEDGEITKDSFAERIGISEFVMESDGSYEVYYDDDDMFYGHVILIDGNMDTGMEDADIAV